MNIRRTSAVLLLPLIIVISGLVSTGTTHAEQAARHRFVCLVHQAWVNHYAYHGNTRQSFRYVASRHYGIETDLQINKANKLYLFHDPGVGYSTAGDTNPLFSSLSTRQVRALRYDNKGTTGRVQSFPVGLRASVGAQKLYVEMKWFVNWTPRLLRNVHHQIVAAHARKRTILYTSNWTLMRYMQSHYPGITISYRKDGYHGDPATTPADINEVRAKVLTRAHVRAWHQAGKRIYLRMTKNRTLWNSGRNKGADGGIIPNFQARGKCR